MIKYKLKNTNTTNSLGSILILEDATGVYSADNLTGYGTPNSDREDVALFVVGQYKTSKADLPVTLRSYDPRVVSSFEATITLDGWYRFILLAFPLFELSVLQSYSVGKILYNPTYRTLVQIVLLPNGDNAAKDINLEDTLGKGYEVDSTDAFIVYNSSKTKIRLNSFISDLLTNNVDFQDKKLVRLKDNYNLVRAILQGASYEFCIGNKNVAQKSIEFLNSNNYV
jgi:hypothetical protein